MSTLSLSLMTRRRLVAYAVLAILLAPISVAISPMFLMGFEVHFADIAPLLGFVLQAFLITLLVTALSVTIAGMALRLRYRTGLQSRTGDFLLLLPLVLGEVVFGASIKISGFVVSLPEFDLLPPAFVQLLVIIVYYTVICTRGAFLFTLLHIQTEHFASLKYARACDLHFDEFVGELAPSVRSYLFISTAILALLLCVSAYSITAVGFRSGPGYGIEVWPQYLARTVKELSAGDPRGAERLRVLAYVVVTLSTLGFAAILVAARPLFRRLQDFAFGNAEEKMCTRVNSIVVGLALIICAYLFTVSFLAVFFGYDAREIDPTIRSKLAISFVACLLLALTIVLGARLAGSFMDTGVSRLRSAAALLAGICIILPLHGLASGSNVLSLKAGATGNAETLIVWLIANVLFLFPIAFGFNLFLESAEPKGKSAYLAQNRIQTSEDFRLFVVPREREAILLFAVLIAFFAWCALPVSSTFDRSIETLATAVFSLTESRGASLRDAAMVITGSVLIVAFSLGLFSRHISQISRSR